MNIFRWLIPPPQKKDINNDKIVISILIWPEKAEVEVL